jgi:hypothetical protein
MKKSATEVAADSRAFELPISKNAKYAVGDGAQSAFDI